MINGVCGIKSTGRICTDLADALTEQGHIVKIAYGRDKVPDEYQKYAHRIGSDIDIRLHGLQSRIFDNTGFGSKKATLRFIEWIKKFDPDVIHLHNLHGYYINIELLFNYLAKADKRVIWTLHDCWSFTGHCPYFTYAKCDKWKQGCSDCPQTRSFPTSWIADNSKNNWKRKKKLFTSVKDMTIVTPSHWLADLVKQSYLKKYPVEVIYNGIDTSVFKPTPSSFRKKYGLEDKKILLGVASVWEKRKGLDDFIRLSEMLDDSYRIVLIGLSKKQIKNLPGNILGFTRTNSTKGLAQIYTAADVFLNLSVEETFGLTTVEAQSCGTPAIVYAASALAEIAPKSAVTPGNLEEIIKMLNSDIKPDISNEDYGKEAMIKKYCDLY